jgi:hypothetical protein
MSTLLEVQGCWERRRDDRSGMCFFHKIEAFEHKEKVDLSISAFPLVLAVYFARSREVVKSIL